ncbi:MAG: glycosyltransferase [Fimbriimonas sp.]|nr:glycosyltransferase [Fimbriimonas sp.]
MHILVMPSWYSNSLQPQSGIFFRHHAQSLAALGHQVGIAFYEARVLRSLSPQGLRENHFQTQISPEFGIPTVRLKGWNPLSQKPAGAKLRGLLYERAALAYIRRYGRPDAVHVQSGMWSGLGALRLHRRLHIPYLLTEHSNFVPGPDDPTMNGLYREVARNAAKVTAVSTSLAQDLRQKTGIEEISIVPNCIEYDLWAKPRPVTDSKTSRFVSVGHLIPLKDFDLLLRAFANVHAKSPMSTLTIVGDGVERNRLSEMAREMGLCDCVTFSGELDPSQVRDVLRSANCYVCASKVETFGVAVLEALACGLPVVSTRCGGPEDFLRAPSSVLVPLGDVDSMARAMLDQIRPDRPEVFEQARQIAFAYSLDQVGPVLEAALKATLVSGATSSGQ